MNFKARDLVSLGVFSAVYLVLYFAINMLASLTPLLQPLTSFATIVICGIVFMLFRSRVRSTGMVALMALLLGLLTLLLGHHVITMATALVAGVAAEIVIAARRVSPGVSDVLGYAFFSLWSAGAILPLLFLREDTLAQVRAQMGNAYADTYAGLMTPGVVLAMVASYFVAGLLGGLLGRRMLAKHFVKAGLA
ncbi:MptD family putative ECF transporter S component [Streptomyces sp. S186]|uniref:MptD family putative ECF transporter S component n=1 Tax=Streptomyces sp. S186 TaxID=3434395 RepID=UPI003F668FE2